jgi:hypothetical protein
MQAPVRDFLVANEVPPDLLEQVFQRPSTDVYWLSDSEETALGAKSPAFGKFLAKNCKWTEGFEKAVYRGERPFEDLKAFADCRARATLAEARKALTLALKEAAPAAPAAATAPGKKPHPKRVKATRKPPAESKKTPSS